MSGNPETFKAVLASEDGTVELELRGYFSIAGNSVYAHYEDMNLVAGSHIRGDLEASKMKAMARLMLMLELKLHTHNKYGDFEGLFLKSVPPQMKDAFVRYANLSKLGEFLENHENKIPVFTENLTSINNQIRFSLASRGTVRDMAQLQLGHSKSPDSDAPGVFNLERMPTGAYRYAYS